MKRTAFALLALTPIAAFAWNVAVPEPSIIALLAAAVVPFAWRLRRK